MKISIINASRYCRRPLVVFYFGILIIGLTANVFCQETLSAFQQNALAICQQKNLGVKILCDPSWPVTRQFQRVVFHVCQTEQKSVTVMIEKSRESGLLLEDLVPSALQYVYDYADHFKYTKLLIGSREIICVIGHPRANANAQLIDYFILHEKNLYRISFKVTPQIDFREYESLFENMIVSFDFMNFEHPLSLPKEELPSGRSD